MILPALNEPDLAELPEEIRRRHDVRAGRNPGAGHHSRTLERSATEQTTHSDRYRSGSGPHVTRVRPASTLAQAIVFYISGHGFGHASRSIEVINAILAKRPETRSRRPHVGAALAVRPHRQGQGHLQHARMRHRRRAGRRADARRGRQHPPRGRRSTATW